MNTVMQTVIAGVLVFVAGQLLLKLVIEPINQLKKTFADIAHTFICYAHAIQNPDMIAPELHSIVFEKLRQLSGQLYADMSLIPLYTVFSSIFCLPRREKVYESAQHLIAVANWMCSKSDYKFDYIVRNIQKACDNLGLYIAPGDRIPDELLQK